MKKIMVRGGMLLGTLAIIAAGAAAFSAFEAHVVNVTATIENALSVNAGDTGALDFGTVFPQEYLTKNISISLSDSFKDTDRVDDVEYVIKQKPKVKQPVLDDCVFPQNGGRPICNQPAGDPNVNPAPGDPYAIIHVNGLGEAPDHTFDGPAWQFCEEYLPKDAPYGAYDPNNIYWKYCYLPLGNYLSKHKDSNEQEAGLTTDTASFDHEVDAFHQAYQWDPQTGESSLTASGIASGKLQKSAGDTTDNWVIDLAVPCFTGSCAQDWKNFVHNINENADPGQFTLPQSLQQKTFGTDLWVEVTGISQNLYGQCGQVVAFSGIGSGHMLLPDTYDYILDPADPSAGNQPDHKWLHLPSTSAEAVWDMNTAVSSLWVVPSIDHGPVPGESNEVLVYGSDNPGGPWTLGTRVNVTDAQGPSNWISDDYTAQWQFNQPYRYIRLKSSASDGAASNQQGLYISDDAEIDAVCSVIGNNQ